MGVYCFTGRGPLKLPSRLGSLFINTGDTFRDDNDAFADVDGFELAPEGTEPAIKTPKLPKPPGGGESPRERDLRREVNTLRGRLVNLETALDEVSKERNELTRERDLLKAQLEAFDLAEPEGEPELITPQEFDKLSYKAKQAKAKEVGLSIYQKKSSELSEDYLSLYESLHGVG